MKNALVPAMVVIALLLGFLVWWLAGSPEATASGSNSRAEAAPHRDSIGQTEAVAVSEKTTRSDAAPAKIASPVPEGDSAHSEAPAAAALASVTTSNAQEGKHGVEVGNEVFEGKYAGMNAELRREAMESLRSRLDASPGSATRKDPALTDKEKLQIKSEVEWLMEHDSP